MSKIVFLGVEGSGKTTLTMALAKAFERHRSEGWYLKPLSRDSFRFLKMLPENLDEESFPRQTADLRELSWQVEYKDSPLTDISILDYPGEIYRLAFLDEKDERDQEAFRQKVTANKREIDALLNAVKEAERVFVLFNLSDAVDLGGNPRNLDAVWVTNACLHLLKELNPKPSIQLLLTQADKYRAAGKDLSKFSLDEIDLVGHDHKDVSWSFVSVVDEPDSEYGIASFVKHFFSASDDDLEDEDGDGDTGFKASECPSLFITGKQPLRHLRSLRERGGCLPWGLLFGFLSVEVLLLNDKDCTVDAAVGVMVACTIVMLAICLLYEAMRRQTQKVFELFRDEQWSLAVKEASSFLYKPPLVKYYLAISYLMGLGGRKPSILGFGGREIDYKKAREFLYGAKQKYAPEVLTALGYMAEKGLDQPPNPELADRFYAEAKALLDKEPQGK